jgi:site-specific recombinase XerD
MQAGTLDAAQRQHPDILDQLDTEGTYQHLFINLRKKMPNMSIYKMWYELRHQYAFFLFNMGHSLYTVQQALEHSDSKVMQPYSHLSTRVLGEASDSTLVFVIRESLPGNG